MNKQIVTPPPSDAGRYRDLHILDELANNDALTQRDLSKQMGIALGLVNSYLKNLIAKGYVTVKNIPSKRYAYYLTPAGFAEKSRLAYDLLSDYTRIYREAKSNYRNLFHELEKKGVRKIIFAGADEVAEIAYITLQDTHLELTGVVDDERKGANFFGREIGGLESCVSFMHDSVIITSYVQRERIIQRLLESGVERKNIHEVFAF